MGLRSSLSCLQEPATGPYPEPDESSPHFPTICPHILQEAIFLRGVEGPPLVGCHDCLFNIFAIYSSCFNCTLVN